MIADPSSLQYTDWYLAKTGKCWSNYKRAARIEFFWRIYGSARKPRRSDPKLAVRLKKFIGGPKNATHTPYIYRPRRGVRFQNTTPSTASAAPPSSSALLRRAIRAHPPPHSRSRDLHLHRMARDGSSGRRGGRIGGGNSPPQPPVFRSEAEPKKWDHSEGARKRALDGGPTGGSRLRGSSPTTPISARALPP
jgi:hypothetical protein